MALCSRDQHCAAANDLPLWVIKGVEASERADRYFRIRSESDTQSEHSITWDPTDSGLPSVNPRPPAACNLDTVDEPLQGRGHRDVHHDITPESPVESGVGVIYPLIGGEIENDFVPSDLPQLFAPAFRGRDQLLRDVLSGFDVKSSRAGVHWIQGEPGSGRTRFLAELRDILRFDAVAIGSPVAG